MTDQNQKNTTVSQVEEDEIDLIAIAKTLWQGRKTIVKTTLIFMGIGLFVAIFSEKEYTASTTFVPQTSDSKIGGNLGGLASLAGINLGSMSSGSEISPSLYPQIINSTPFQLEMLQTPLTIADQKEKITFEEYYKNHYRPSVLGYIKKYTIGLPGLIVKTFRSTRTGIDSEANYQSIQTLTLEESKLLKRIETQFILKVNEDDGFITIDAVMPEPIAAAELSQYGQKLLQSYIIDFKVQKSKSQLQFIEKRHNEKKLEFRKIQEKYTLFKDRNQFINKATTKSILEGLQDDYDIAFNVYNELAKQKETQLIQVKEDTPVFTILKPVTIPIERSSPRRMLIIINCMFFGFIIGSTAVLSKKTISNLKNALNN